MGYSIPSEILFFISIMKFTVSTLEFAEMPLNLLNISLTDYKLLLINPEYSLTLTDLVTLACLCK